MKEKMNQSDGKFQPSLFKGFRATSPLAVTWDEVFRLLTSGELQEFTERYRYFHTHGLDAYAAKVKSAAPSITPAVQCNGGRRMEQIEGYTGFSLCDFDHVKPEEMERCLALLRADEHVFLAYVTFSGTGIRVIFRADDVAVYAEAFSQGNEYFAALIGQEYDPQCKNPARLSSLCHDAGAYYNPEASPVAIRPKVKAKAAGKRAAKRRPVTIERAVAALQDELEARGVGYEPGRHNEYISQAAYLLNRYGVPEADALTWALARFADYGAAQVEQIVHSCYKHTDEFGNLPLPRAARAEGRSEVTTVGEIEAFLTAHAQFRENIILRQCEISFDDGKTFSSVTDRDLNSLWVNISKSVGRTHFNDLHNVLRSDFTPLYNPFQDYIDSLPPWDGVTDYIGQLAATVHVQGNQERFVTYFRKWFVGIFPTLFEEETVNHEILVLVGKQGIYKTTWLHRLLPPSLRRYFYTKTNSRRMDKDDKFTMTEFVLICFEEIDGMRSSELNQLKAMTSLPDVNERAAYGRTKERRQRIASFCGTGNNLQFLTDITGNRRWLPFEVLAIDNPYEYKVEYEGLFSQAYALWKSGFCYWFCDEEIEVLKHHNQYFEVPNLEEELINTYYRRPVPGETSAVFVTTARILERINAAIRQPLSAIKIGMVMKKMGYEPIRSNGMRGYRVIERTAEEIQAAQRAIAAYT